jgi:hypothetical protein
MAQTARKSLPLTDPGISQLLRGPDASIPNGMEIFESQERHPHPGWIHRRFREVVVGKNGSKSDAQRKKP